MRINHNIAALNTYNKLSANTAATSKSLEKLSSGLKINKAGDDAAGLAISEKMRGQIRGLDMASKNANDGISLISTAEGALNETHSILQRMRELAVQSSNDTNSSDDRNEIQKEIDQLVSEIDRIGNQTEFNQKKLLNGGAGIQGNISGTDKAVILGGSEDVISTGTLAFTALTASQKGVMDVQVHDTNLAGAAVAMDFVDGTMSVNGVSVQIVTADTLDTVVAKINNVSGSTGVTASTTANTLTFTTNSTGSGAKIDVSGLDTVIDQTTGGDALAARVNGGAYAAADNSESATGKDATVTIGAAGGGATTAPTTYTASGNIITFVGGQFNGLMIKADAAASNTAGTIEITANSSLSMHIGANENQTMGVSINDMRSLALGVSSIDVTSKTKAESAITSIDDAVKIVSSERSKLGAYQNRLEHTINNLGTSSENLSAAESRIRDVDMAKEMMEFTKNNILSQAAQAMLAQANQQPQGVLQLLQ